jgi:hypothetical protein
VVANSLYLGETERLFREVALAGVLEVAALALRAGHGLIGDTAGDVVREIWHSYPGAGLKGGTQPRSVDSALPLDKLYLYLRAKITAINSEFELCP